MRRNFLFCIVFFGLLLFSGCTTKDKTTFHLTNEGITDFDIETYLYPFEQQSYTSLIQRAGLFNTEVQGINNEVTKYYELEFIEFKPTLDQNWKLDGENLNNPSSKRIDFKIRGIIKFREFSK